MLPDHGERRGLKTQQTKASKVFMFCNQLGFLVLKTSACLLFTISQPGLQNTYEMVCGVRTKAPLTHAYGRAVAGRAGAPGVGEDVHQVNLAAVQVLPGAAVAGAVGGAHVGVAIFCDRHRRVVLGAVAVCPADRAQAVFTLGEAFHVVWSAGA